MMQLNSILKKFYEHQINCCKFFLLFRVHCIQFQYCFYFSVANFYYIFFLDIFFFVFLIVGVFTDNCLNEFIIIKELIFEPIPAHFLTWAQYRVLSPPLSSTSFKLSSISVVILFKFWPECSIWQMHSKAFLHMP